MVVLEIGMEARLVRVHCVRSPNFYHVRRFSNRVADPDTLVKVELVRSSVEGKGSSDHRVEVQMMEGMGASQ